MHSVEWCYLPQATGRFWTRPFVPRDAL